MVCLEHVERSKHEKTGTYCSKPALTQEEEDHWIWGRSGIPAEFRATRAATARACRQTNAVWSAWTHPRCQNVKYKHGSLEPQTPGKDSRSVKKEGEEENKGTKAMKRFKAIYTKKRQLLNLELSLACCCCCSWDRWWCQQHIWRASLGNWLQGAFLLVRSCCH